MTKFLEPGWRPLGTTNDRTGQPQLGAAARWDPYGFPYAKTPVTWVAARREHDLRLTCRAFYLPKQLTVTPIESEHTGTWEKAMRRALSPIGLAILGQLATWSVMTTQQLAAATGIEALTRLDHYVLRDMHNLGLIEYGTLGTQAAQAPSSYLPLLVRLARPETVERLTADVMTDQQYLTVTAGRGWPYQRDNQSLHALMNVEWSLRGSTMHPHITGVLGESLAATTTLLGHTPGHYTFTSTADAAWILNDGRRLAIEMTCSETDELDKKVHSWAKRLQEDTDRHLAVLFVIAPPRGEDKVVTAITKLLKKGLSLAISDKYLSESPSNPHLSRIFYTRWTDWYRPGEISSNAQDLEVLPLLEGRRSDAFLSPLLYSPAGVWCPPPSDPGLPCRLAGLAQTFHWLRPNDHDHADHARCGSAFHYPVGSDWRRIPIIATPTRPATSPLRRPGFASNGKRIAPPTPLHPRLPRPEEADQ